MDCTAAAVRRTVADCRKAENSVRQGNYLGADILRSLRYRRTSIEVEMTDFESLFVARPAV